ncbi:hypothetical protein M422DRAFT_38033 [Sphaerobolus stellatus SS14]|uniref:Uncharacterized protein n=1 Tax=Sphaerobolus stellatus (strain SS14) TaxID=990650 RepID=A0A0C9TYJ5_SPHS4|nr:hypothetical protein M422DRAFT_38033 [Sphaerobolus stellatus SS14]
MYPSSYKSSCGILALHMQDRMLIRGGVDFESCGWLQRIRIHDSVVDIIENRSL